MRHMVVKVAETAPLQLEYTNFTSRRHLLQRGEPAQRSGSPSPLLNKERGGFSRGEVLTVFHRSENRYILI